MVLQALLVAVIALSVPDVSEVQRVKTQLISLLSPELLRQNGCFAMIGICDGWQSIPFSRPAFMRNRNPDWFDPANFDRLSVCVWTGDLPCHSIIKHALEASQGFKSVDHNFRVSWLDSTKGLRGVLLRKFLSRQRDPDMQDWTDSIAINAIDHELSVPVYVRLSLWAE
jgi:hypothetical protein